MTYDPLASSYPPDLIAKVEKNLEESCPSAEPQVVALCKVMANREISGELGAFLRRVTIDTDDLASQMRWNLGQALLVMHLHPEMLKQDKDQTTGGKKYGMPINAQLLIREYVKDADAVFFESLSENRRGGTVGGWIFHMSVDNAIFRALSALDRLAVLAWHAAGLSKDEKIYFRSGKLEKINNVLSSPESKAILEIAKGPLLELMTAYRDGFSHTQKVHSSIAGLLPVDSWVTENGELVFRSPQEWNADSLFALANASYAQFREALPYVTAICEKRWPSNEPIFRKQ